MLELQVVDVEAARADMLEGHGLQRAQVGDHFKYMRHLGARDLGEGGGELLEVGLSPLELIDLPSHRRFTIRVGFLLFESPRDFVFELLRRSRVDSFCSSVAAVLVQHQRGGIALLIRLECKLRIDNLGEKLDFALRVHRGSGLAGALHG